MNNKNRYLGFVALISVVLISAILMLVATSLSFSGFYSRYNILDSELKAQSMELAKACVDTALLKLARISNYNPNNEHVVLGENSCTIQSVSASSAEKIILTQSTYKNYKTNLSIKIRSNDLSIISWEEMP